MKYKKSTTITEGIEREKSNKNRHYIDKQKFYLAFVERAELIKKANQKNKPIPRISNFLGECIFMIANKVGSRHNFRHYTFIEDMIGDAVMTSIRYIDKFDVNKSDNPFSYFTQICNYAFLNRMHTENKQKYLKYKTTLEQIHMGGNQDVEYKDKQDNTFTDEFDSTHMTDFIDDYELKQKNTKKTKKVIMASALSEICF